VRFVVSQNAWEKAFGEREEVGAKELDAGSIDSAFESALSHNSDRTAIPSANSHENRASAGCIHFDTQLAQASGKHSDSELSLARIEMPEAIPIVESGGSHRTCEGFPGSRTSGKHLTGDLSLAAHESENVGSRSNHDEHEASPVPLVLTSTSSMHQSDEAFLSDPIITNADSMHLLDEVSLGCSERDTTDPSGIRL